MTSRAGRAASPAAPNDRFYRLAVALGRTVFRVCSRPVVLHAERSSTRGGALLASNHVSPYDVVCLMNVCRRPIDFVSIVELMDRPLVGALFRALNCMALDRGRMDPVTAREILGRLRAGRLVGMFPEGGLRPAEASVLRGGSMVSGIGQLAQLAAVPVIPCLVADTGNFARRGAWLPLRRTRYAVAFGVPLRVREDQPRQAARDELEERWRRSLLELEAELEPRLTWPAR
ncbi:MAG TPA: lysophospholipid acyltransferase family protein [Thermoanaerobaculia bacterium]|nr:lysophospholipid acyltransferase family protein [Thermoanaerobaculia bacterium]